MDIPGCKVLVAAVLSPPTPCLLERFAVYECCRVRRNWEVAARALTISQSGSLMGFSKVHRGRSQKREKNPESNSCFEKNALMSGVRDQNGQTGWRA